MLLVPEMLLVLENYVLLDGILIPEIYVLLLCRNYAGYYLFQILLTDDARSNAGFDAGFVPSLMLDFFPLYAGMMTPNMSPDSMPDMFLFMPEFCHI